MQVNEPVPTGVDKYGDRWAWLPSTGGWRRIETPQIELPDSEVRNRYGLIAEPTPGRPHCVTCRCDRLT